MLFHINQIFKWDMCVPHVCMCVIPTPTQFQKNVVIKKKKVGHVIIKYLLLLFGAPFYNYFDP